jgi:hypothetical protein
MDEKESRGMMVQPLSLWTWVCIGLSFGCATAVGSLVADLVIKLVKRMFR